MLVRYNCTDPGRLPREKRNQKRVLLEPSKNGMVSWYASGHVPLLPEVVSVNLPVSSVQVETQYLKTVRASGCRIVGKRARNFDSTAVVLKLRNLGKTAVPFYLGIFSASARGGGVVSESGCSAGPDAESFAFYSHVPHVIFSGTGGKGTIVGGCVLKTAWTKWASQAGQRTTKADRSRRTKEFRRQQQSRGSKTETGAHAHRSPTRT